MKSNRSMLARKPTVVLCSKDALVTPPPLLPRLRSAKPFLPDSGVRLIEPTSLRPQTPGAYCTSK
ncbi:hypothetical protein CGRA01v4_07139 [Colletotrichum graminicola]|nr:hypothetical protein CGRA01v4_07139 [Colletotrichum graminicola]